MENKISKKDLFNVIKHGHNWHAAKVKEQLEKLLTMNSRAFHHDFRYDVDDKYHYIYDNECYLFVFDGKVEVRCDRDDGPSANRTFTYQISDAKDIKIAYDKFISVITESE
jgi:hypothetical protein